MKLDVMGGIGPPARLTACVPAESTTDRLAVSEFVVLGVKVTLKVQLALTATEVPQPFVCAKSALFVPAMEILVMDKAAVPVFVRVAVCAGLVVPTVTIPKLSEEGTSVACAAGALPVPVRLTDWVPTVSAIVTLAVLVPVAAGLKVTLIMQLALAATVEPQVFVSLKSPAFVPVMEMLVTDRTALPELVSVTACADEDVPTLWLPNVSELTDKLAPGPVGDNADEPEPPPHELNKTDRTRLPARAISDNLALWRISTFLLTMEVACSN